MTDLPQVRRFFRIASVRPDPKGDVDAELEFHFERSVEDLMAKGYKRPAAEEEAGRRFGDLELYRSELRKISRQRVKRERRSEWWLVLRQNLAYAARGLRRTPGFTVGVALTLALGIGANATMFGVIDRLLLSAPAQVEDPGQVRRLYVERPDLAGNPIVSQTVAFPDYQDWEGSRPFTSVAAYYTTRMTLGRSQAAARVTAEYVTASFFPLLGVKPALGRFFDSGDDRVGAEGVAILSHGFWENHFAADSSVLGSVLDLGEGPYTVVGIAPRRFTGLDLGRVDVWLPLHAHAGGMPGDPDWLNRYGRGWYWLETVVRLAPGVSAEAAEVEATRLHRLGRKEEIDQGRYAESARVVVAPLITARGPLASDESLVSRWLVGVSLAVLLIACANVANLLLARGSRRKREIAVRLALGISRGRLVAQLFCEGALLAGLGGLLALAVTVWGAAIMRTALLPDLAWVDSPVSLRVLAFTAVVSAVAALLAGLAPALQTSRPDISETLKLGARGGVVRRSKTRLALQVAQAALSVVLLVGAGLFIRSLHRITSVDLGFDPHGVVFVTLEREPGITGSPELTDLYRRSLERLQAVPDVQAASIATALPMWGLWAEYIAVPGIDSLPRPTTGGPYITAVTPDHFEVLGMRILRGRGFTVADDASAPRVAVINQSMAKGIWQGEDPLGRCLIIGAPDAPCAEVIGIVADSHQQAVVEEPHWLYFVPLEQTVLDHRPDVLLARGAGDPDELALTVRGALTGSVPGVRLVIARPLQDVIDPQLRSWRLGATMFTLFGLLALVVAAVGLYSLLSFNVAQRSHEIGIRTAIGATRDRVVALVVKQGILICAVGIALGLLVVVILGGPIAPLLFEVSPRDPAVLGLVVVILLAVAMIAAAVPAWRASRVDPNAVLRAE